MSGFWDAEAAAFDDEPDHGLRDPEIRAAWLALGLLRPGGRLVLVEGRWHTGAGLTARDTEAMVRAAGRTPTTYDLGDEDYWGGPITDERYLVVA